MIRPQYILDLNQEIIVDNFAGGGGASTGIELALGRHVDVAINHDPEAVAMHSANHPQTRHYCESVWEVDPRDVEPGRPIGLLWLSPDCKHFSKAKGGKPVEKKIRGLAWVAVRWADLRKPRVIMLENVEEFITWGPLITDENGNSRPCPKNKGREFNAFVNALRSLGYVVDWKELRACDFGAPTIRKRLFLIARRDGQPIVWPEPTHGDPKSAITKAKKLKPWRTAAECIDWSIPCPSIFERSKPLAEATLRRIAKGIMRYVVNAKEPFIVGQGGPIYSGKPKLTSEPFGTLTTENHRSLVMPSIIPVTHQGSDRIENIDEPMRTVTGAHRGEKALITPIITRIGQTGGNGLYSNSVEDPLTTVVSKAEHLVVAPMISTYYGDKRPEDVRGIVMDRPLPTQTTENRHALVSAFMAKHYTGVVGADLTDPTPTVTSVDHNSLVTATLVGCGGRAGQSRPRTADEPLQTITSKADTAIVTAHIQRDYGSSVGHDAVAPLGTTTAGGGGKSALVTSNLVKLRGTSKDGQATNEPLHTISAGGTHHAEVRAFLIKYYGADQDPRLEEPLHTVTSRDRFGLVKVAGEDYAIVDIGLRMLAPRELFRAQGFPEHYIIGDDPSQGLTLTKSAQVRMCGNSVCPPLAAALVRANLAEIAIRKAA